MASKALKQKTRRVFEKRYKRKLTDAEVEAIIRWSVKFARSLQ